MSSFSMAVPWLEYVIMGAVIGGFLIFIAWRITSYLRRGSIEDPLPRLDREPRAATVVAVHRARQRENTRRRRRQEHPCSHDAWLIEVEYVDASGSRRRALLADVIATNALDRFSSGAMCRVYAFSAPRTRFQRGRADALPTERCLLTEEHGGILRAGFDLDGVRARSERQIWDTPRVGSPMLGVMPFVSDNDPWAGEVTGRRISYPGEPRAEWKKASQERVPPLKRSRDVPWPISVEEVAKWEDPDGFGRTELYYAPIFWVFLPGAALGYLIWGMITDPGEGWTGNFFDNDATGDLWNFWIVWVGVAIWLLIAIAVLVFRVSLTSEVRTDNEWIFRHGVPCTIHRSPFTRDGGEGDRWPTFIAIEHGVPNDQAARIHHALHEWLKSEDVQAELSVGAGGSVISSQDLFGSDAAGGYYLPVIPGFGTAEDFAAHDWVLVTEPRDEDVEGAQMTVTTVPLEKKRAKIRNKLRTKKATLDATPPPSPETRHPR